MIEGELYLLEAVKWYLQHTLQLNDNQCDIQPEEVVPAIAGDLYIAIIPAGAQPGPRHNTSGQVRDYYYSVQVVVYRRTPNEPRDRVKNVYRSQLSGVNALLKTINKAIGWNPSVTAYATNLAKAEFPNAQFAEQLREISVEPRPRMVVPDTFGAVASGGKGATPYVGMARGITFGRCRFLNTI